MKSFIIALIICASLITGGVIYTNKIISNADRLAKINDEILTAIKEEDYPQAEDKIKNLKSEIDTFSDFYYATDNHTDIDSIRTALAELESFTKNQVSTDALAKAEVLRFYFEHLPEKTRISIGNIL